MFKKRVLKRNQLDSELFFLQKLEEVFAQQLEEQERVFGPIMPLSLPSDLPELNSESSRLGVGSTRSSLSSVSEG